MKQTSDIVLKPAMTFAFMKCLPMILTGAIFLLLAWTLSPYFLLFSLAATGAAWYRILLIRNCSYLITQEYIRTTRGIFFRRVDQIEMFRVKDYIMTQSFVLQVLKLMDVTLKSTDPENPVVWFRGIPQSDVIDTIRERVLEARRDNNIYELN